MIAAMQLAPIWRASPPGPVTRVPWYRVLAVVEPDHLAEGGQVGAADDLAVVHAPCPILLPVVPELVCAVPVPAEVRAFGGVLAGLVLLRQRDADHRPQVGSSARLAVHRSACCSMQATVGTASRSAAWWSLPPSQYPYPRTGCGTDVSNWGLLSVPGGAG